MPSLLRKMGSVPKGKRSGGVRRALVSIAALAVVLATPLNVDADYLGTKINRIFLDPDSIAVVADGYDLDDVISYILETTPEDTGSTEGHAAWMTLYVPAGVVIVGAEAVVKQEGAGTC